MKLNPTRISLFVLITVIDVFLGTYLWNSLIVEIFQLVKLNMFQFAAILTCFVFVTSNYQFYTLTDDENTDPYTLAFIHIARSSAVAMIAWILAFFI